MIIVIADNRLPRDGRVMNERTNAMNRTKILKTAAEFGLMAAIALSAIGELSASSGQVEATSASDGNKPAVKANPLKAPVQGSIPVAFLVSEDAVIIDFCGPWEVFQDVNIPGRQAAPFRIYTVAETTAPIRASGGMKIVPDYTLENAPAPKVIVIPAQSEPNEAVLEWIRKATRNTDVTMSVCTGAFVLAKTGLLSAKAATPFHIPFNHFAVQFPHIHLNPGAS